MAHNSDFQKRLCVAWNTTFPLHGEPRISSNFSVLGSEWNLKLTLSLNDWHYKLHLQRGNDKENLKDTFQVTTFVGINSDALTGISINSHLHDICVVETTEQVIWNFTLTDISNRVPSFTIDGSWSIVCIFQCEPPPATQTIHVSTQTYMDVPPDLESLSVDFCSLLVNEVFPDVKLRCGDRTISAHRSILAGRSQVFAAMFRNKMVESETGIVDITDVTFPILELLLKYVYSGKVTGLSDDITSNLYEAGDKYAMHSLKNACSDWMIKNLTQENCLSFLTVADVHGDVAFRDAVFSFINRHSELLYSEDWLKFSEEHPKLANAAYRSYLMSIRN